MNGSSRSPKSRFAFVLLASAVSACVDVSDGSQSPSSPRDERFAKYEQASRDRAAREQEARRSTGEKKTPPLPPLGDCPSDMSISPGPRGIDTRKLPNAVISVFAKGHQEPPPDGFFTPPAKAVDAVIADEKKAPNLLPAGFRAAVLASPKDAALRLKVARCELEHDETRRRASYDAALAILIAGPSDDATAILLESTKHQNKRETVATCTSASDCSKGSTCDPIQKECVTPTVTMTNHISQIEFDIEDALTRALLRPGMSFDDYKQFDYFWWCATRLHRCGGAGNTPCQLSGYVDKVVSWDLRDGGGSYSPPERVQQWYRDHCARGSTSDCDQTKPSWVE